MDNAAGRFSSTAALRHDGLENMGFVDGHVKPIRMRMANFAGYGTVVIPVDPTNAVKWCYDPNAVGDYSGAGGGAGYPISGNGETCTAVANGLYANSTPLP